MILKPKITVVGSGYVGMSLAVLLAQHNEVTILDIDSIRVDKIIISNLQSQMPKLKPILQKSN
jgi:UDP-glucose 6-dehydrogenase